MMAADAFPVMGGMTKFESIEQYDQLMLCGTSTKEPRLTSVPVRIPQPQPDKAGSIYEIQAVSDKPGYATFEEVKHTR